MQNFQKTKTPVINNGSEVIDSTLASAVCSIWLEIRDDYRTLIGLTEEEKEEAVDND